MTAGAKTLTAEDQSLLLANAALLGLKLDDGMAQDAQRASDCFADASTKLAVYGSLGPGRENEHVMTRIGGAWRGPFLMPGAREAKGWGATLGYPGASWRPGVGEIEVSVFVSDALPAHWADLDAFEGDEYARLYVSLWREGVRADVAFAYVIRNSSLATIQGLVAAGSR